MRLIRVLPALWVAISTTAAVSCVSGTDDPSNAEGGSSGSGQARSGSGTSTSGATGGEKVDATVESSPDGGGVGDASEAVGDGAPVVRVPITDSSCAYNNFTQTSFVNLAPPPGDPLDPNENDPIPSGDAGTDAGADAGADAGTVPPGWHFYQIDGAICRDGSPTGFYVRYTTSTKLMIYLEGGGTCSSPHFCDHNPANMHEFFPGGALNGESFAQSLLLAKILQAPGTDGIFDTTNSDNPFKDWNQIYVPYCTGDAHAGANESAQLNDGVDPLVKNTWHFVGYLNMKKFVSRIAPTFKSADQVVLTGSSAGGLGAGVNYGMVQDAFGSVPVTLLDDSFPPFLGSYIATCLQEDIRTLWALDSVFPPDCVDCLKPGGLTQIVPYWHHKYPNARFGLVSSMHDQIIRLFLASGANNCKTDDPNILSGLALEGSNVPGYDAGEYQNALADLRANYNCTNIYSSYYIGTGDPDASDKNGSIDTLHEHIFRPRFFAPLAGPALPTLAQWTSDLVNGKPVEALGP